MNVTSTGGSDYASLGRLTTDSASIRQQLDTLNQQGATGRIAETYAGLGSGARTSLALRPLLAHQTALQTGIDAATGRMTVTQTAMTQIQSIAATLVSQLNDLNGLNSESVDTIAASARSALQQVAGLLDTKDGDTYVFAGQDSSNPPVPDPDAITSSGFYTQINAAVAGLGSDASTVSAATLATAASNTAGTSPFSASQSQSAGSIPVATAETGPGQRTQVGLLASANSFVTSTGSATTGSYMRDVLRALATVGSLSSSQLGAGGFTDLVQDVRTSLNGAISAMAADVGVLGNTQTQLADTKTQLGDMSAALTTQVSSAEDVDMAATISQIALTKTQLEASYQLISGMQGLSLVKYLS